MKNRIFSVFVIFSLLLTAASCKSENISQIEISIAGGSGKTKLVSPAVVKEKNQKYYVQLVFSSKNYDYVIFEGKKYLNEQKNGSSTFTIPVKNLTTPFEILADTTAMSAPHEIKYTVSFGSEQNSVSAAPDSAAAARELAAAPDSAAAARELAADQDEVHFEKAVLESEALTKTGEIPFSYAKGIKISKYGDYRLIEIENSGTFFVVPENHSVPQKLSSDVVILQQPLDKTYLVSTSQMDFAAKLGCINMIRFSPLQEKDWYVEEAAVAMKNGKMLYAGKYNIPDYELLLSENCSFAIENTMILHSPQVKEKLEKLNIPVLIERSTYEENPLGRLEWVKLYGTLFGKEEEALSFFEEQLKKLEPVLNQTQTGKTAAIFSFSENGSVNVRKSGDYMAKIVEIAGGKYIPENLLQENNTGTMNIQEEKFYAEGLDADVLIYNGTIDGSVQNLSSLLQKKNILSNFKAVQKGNIYCIEKSLFQKTTGLSDFILDINKVLNGNNEKLVYLKKLE